MSKAGYHDPESDQKSYHQHEAIDAVSLSSTRKIPRPWMKVAGPGALIDQLHDFSSQSSHGVIFTVFPSLVD